MFDDICPHGWLNESLWFCVCVLILFIHRIPMILIQSVRRLLSNNNSHLTECNTCVLMRLCICPYTMLHTSLCLPMYVLMFLNTCPHVELLEMTWVKTRSLSDVFVHMSLWFGEYVLIVVLMSPYGYVHISLIFFAYVLMLCCIRPYAFSISPHAF